MFSDQSHVTNQLAQFVVGSHWETIPPEVRREGVRGLLNFVGCALVGAQDEAVGIALKVLAPFFGPPQGIVIGRGDRPNALKVFVTTRPTAFGGLERPARASSELLSMNARG